MARRGGGGGHLGECGQGQVIVPGLAGGAAPAAEQAIDLDARLFRRLELDLDLAPVAGAGDRRGGHALEVVEVDQGSAAAVDGLDVLGADPAGEPVAGERLHPDRRVPCEVTAGVGGEFGAAAAGAGDVGVLEGALTLNDGLGIGVWAPAAGLARRKASAEAADAIGACAFTPWIVEDEAVPATLEGRNCGASPGNPRPGEHALGEAVDQDGRQPRSQARIRG